MHIVEQPDMLVLTNGEGSPRRGVLLQAAFVVPIALALLGAQLWAAIDGWAWGWIAAGFVSAGLIMAVRAWRELCHATVEIDRRFGHVRVERRYAHKIIEEKLDLRDVAMLEVVAARDGDGDATYRPVLALKDGRRIALGPQRSDRGAMDRAIEAAGKLD